MGYKLHYSQQKFQHYNWYNCGYYLKFFRSHNLRKYYHTCNITNPPFSSPITQPKLLIINIYYYQSSLHAQYTLLKLNLSQHRLELHAFVLLSYLHVVRPSPYKFRQKATTSHTHKTRGCQALPHARLVPIYVQKYQYYALKHSPYHATTNHRNYCKTKATVLPHHHY